uniref:Metalloendopeptidase n=1 Tax=Haemonchus contortus TaxID=6289 RepID=W6N977_HAECO
MNPRQSQILAFGALLCLLLDSGFALSDKGRASLAKALKGVDLEQRRERLRKLQGADLDVTLVGASPKIVQNVGMHSATNSIYSIIGATMKALVKRTLAYLAARTCLTFTESSTAANRIRVFSGSGCYSNVGMSGGEQALSLADGCNTMGIVAHEFMHALGIFHMQSRYDRDSFVTINLTNVPEESRHNYNKYTSAQTVNYTPYEFGSVMHYDAKSFATTGESMIPKNARFLYTIGSQMISFYDLSMINTHYKCNVLRNIAAKCTTGAKCVNGGKRNPKNCATCICPAGYGGALCNQRPAGCGAVLTAAATWKTRKIVQGNDTDTDIRQAHAICNDWIKAPTGKKVQVKVTALNGVYCQYGCWVQGIEFKTLANKLNTNPK